MDEATDLRGKRVVVVEDDFLLANDICRQLRDLGATVLGPAPTPFYATQLIGHRRIDAAVLDIGLHGATVFGVADLLQSQGVPILFATALDRNALPARFVGVSMLSKPLDRLQLAREIVAMTRRPVVQIVKVAPVAAELPSQELPVHAFARAVVQGFDPR